MPFGGTALLITVFVITGTMNGKKNSLFTCKK